jgi:hypothetical protein
MQGSIQGRFTLGLLRQIYRHASPPIYPEDVLISFNHLEPDRVSRRPVFD